MASGLGLRIVMEVCCCCLPHFRVLGRFFGLSWSGVRALSRDHVRDNACFKLTSS